MKTIDKEEVFLYLDRLRESGVTNMWGAGSYIEMSFEVTERESTKLLVEWMETFSERHPK